MKTTWTFDRAFDNRCGHVLIWKDNDGNQIRTLAHGFWAGRSAFDYYGSDGSFVGGYG